MKDYNDPKQRQQFLQENISRNVMNKKMNNIRNNEKYKSVYAETGLIGKLIDYFESAAEGEYKALRRRLRLRKRYVI